RALTELSVWVALAMLLFYSFIWGSASTERYWLPFAPLLFGVSAAGLVEALRGVERGYGRRAALGAALVVVLWLGVLYGREYVTKSGYDHVQLLQIVATRAQREQDLRGVLGVPAPTPFSIGMQEIQYRFF